MELLQLEGPDGLHIGLHALGASWLSCRVPLGRGRRREVVLGFDRLEQLQSNRAYVGACVGRWANRIAGARLQRDGRCWTLATPPGLSHQLHGGPDGFHRRTWTLQDRGPAHAVFALHSPAGDQGFPGALQVRAGYRLIAGLAVQVELEATVEGEATPVCLTSHAYFQLDGTPVDVRSQRLGLAASRVQPVDPEGLPQGEPVAVAGTDLDFRQPRAMTRAVDHAFVLDDSTAPAATLTAADGRLSLQLHTSLPALQVYTGEFLGTDTAALWPAFTGIALEPGYLPDSPNRPPGAMPDVWVAPGRTWRQRSVYRFIPAKAVPAPAD